MHRRRSHSLLLSTVLASILLSSQGAERAAAQPLPQSPEFQINTYTSLNQSAPSIAADSQGGFVVVWEQQDSMGFPDDIVARRFDSSGTGLAPDFQVNVYTTSRQRSPSVARSTGGGFVVVWASSYQDGAAYGIFGRRFDSAGNPLAIEFQVNSYTLNVQTAPRVAIGSGGDFVVVWQSSTQDGDLQGVFGRRFDSGGGGLGAEFQISIRTADDQQGPNVFLKGDGSFIVTWFSDLQDGSVSGAFGRRYSSAGAAIGGEFQLNAYTLNGQIVPTLAYTPSGGFIAAWASDEQDGSDFGVFGRRFDSGALPLGGEFQINEHTAATQSLPTVLPVPSGFVVVWNSGLQDGDGYGIFARAFNNEAQPRGDEVAVNTTTVSEQRFPRAVATGQHFVVVWQSANQDGSNFGLFARRFLIPLTLDVDGNGQVQPLTDGILVLRYTFGFSGNTLISGVVAGNCTRCDAPSIEAYLDNI